MIFRSWKLFLSKRWKMLVFMIVFCLGLMCRRVSAVEICSCFTSKWDFNRYLNLIMSKFSVSTAYFLKICLSRHPCKYPRSTVKRELVQGIVCWIQHKTSKSSCTDISPRGKDVGRNYTGADYNLKNHTIMVTES